jgi:hypothetical protein
MSVVFSALAVSTLGGGRLDSTMPSLFQGRLVALPPPPPPPPPPTPPPPPPHKITSDLACLNNLFFPEVIQYDFKSK